jgi:hypothetical protein
LIKYCRTENSFWFRYLLDYFDDKYEISVEEYQFDFFKNSEFFRPREFQGCKDDDNEMVSKIWEDFNVFAGELGIQDSLGGPENYFIQNVTENNDA